jgi:multiple sugar transport system substrate-binding protein
MNRSRSVRSSTSCTLLHRFLYGLSAMKVYPLMEATKIAVVLLAMSCVACDGNEAPEREALDAIAINVWAHAGQESERKVLRHQVRHFNAAQDEVHVQLTFIPERGYNAYVQAAAANKVLPDLLEFDGPFLYHHVREGHLQTLDDLLPKEVLDDLLPSVRRQGTYAGKLYSVGTFDSWLGLYGRRSQLQAIGVRTPTSNETAWRADELDATLAALAARDSDGAVLDLKLNYPGEWLTYAFSPIVQSAGGDLIDRANMASADEVLNGPEAVNAMRWLQAWFQKGYVDLNVDDAAFVSGRVALSWSGHWDYRRYSKKFGDDLVVMPLPDFGTGPKAARGSWTWGVTASSPRPEAAARFLQFLLEPEQVLEIVEANGALPATRTALSRSRLYGPGEPLESFSEQLLTLENQPNPRPDSPAYPVITLAFQRAFRNIQTGADVKSTLDEAVRIIDKAVAAMRRHPSLNEHR